MISSAWAFLMLGLTMGALLGWWLTLRAWRREAAANTHDGAALRTQLEALLPTVAETVLASKARQLEQTAEAERKLLVSETTGQVNRGQAGLEAMLQQLQQRLAEYQTRINAFEVERGAAQARILQQVDTMAATGAAMARETQTLREALATSSGVRGRWGEAVLKNILDACGLNENVDYVLQVSMSEGDRRSRPDVIIQLPSGRKLIVDAKASLSDFLEGLDQPDPTRRAACFKEFARVLRRRADELAGKDYSRNLADSLPCVVMFVPVEGAFRAALDADPELYRYGQDQRPAVLLASPSTLFPLISVVAHGWTQHRASQKMRQLIDEVNVFGDRLRVFVEFTQQIGKGLDTAGKAYEKALKSYNSRLAPQIGHLKELGAAWDDATELKPIESRPLLADAAEELKPIESRPLLADAAEAGRD